MSIEIELDEPEDVEYNSVEAAKILSAQERKIHISFEGSPLFSLTVPKGIYNPYKSVGAPAIMDKIMDGTIDVKGKRLVDLGCGSGALGLTAAIKGAGSVLYTDINTACVAIKDHPSFRSVDRVAVQSFCENENDGSFDMIIMSIPAIVIEHPIDNTSVEPSFFCHESFVSSLIKDVERVLAPGGEFICFYRIYFEHIPRFTDMLVMFNHSFTLDSLTYLYQNVEKKGVATVFSIRRKKETNDKPGSPRA